MLQEDGMGTTVLSAVSFIKKIPNFYFQAVGSGIDTVAAWETNLRLIEDGRFGSHKMSLFFQCMKHGNYLKETSLSNRQPWYSIGVWLFGVLSDTNGFVCSVTNEEVPSPVTLLFNC
jgi:cysteate synthase